MLKLSYCFFQSTEKQFHKQENGLLVETSAKWLIIPLNWEVYSV